MEIKLKAIKKTEGEITYLFAAIILSFFIVIYISIIVITTNYFNIEYYTREIANRISIKSLVISKSLLTRNEIEKEFKNELKILRENINIKTCNRILEEFFEGNKFTFEETLKYENIKVFKVSYDRGEPYKIGGILKYKPKCLAYIFVTLNEEIKELRNEN